MQSLTIKLGLILVVIVLNLPSLSCTDNKPTTKQLRKEIADLVKARDESVRVYEIMKKYLKCDLDTLAERDQSKAECEAENEKFRNGKPYNYDSINEEVEKLYRQIEEIEMQEKSANLKP
jgi:hypothetical protein